MSSSTDVGLHVYLYTRNEKPQFETSTQNIVILRVTSSSAVADKPGNALCPSVVIASTV